MRQKLLVLALVASSLAVLFVALVVGSVGVDLIHNTGVAGGVLSYVYALAVSTGLIFGLVWTLYNLLTNAALTWRETFPGAVFATVLLQVSFQALPAFVRLTSGDLVTLQAFGGLVLLLFWLYLMANVLVLGAEVNWWFRYGRAATRGARDRGDRLAGREPLFERRHDFLLDLRLVLEEAAEGLARKHEEAERRGGGHRGGAARVVVDQGDLAEEVARAEPSDLVPVLRRPRRRRRR